MQYLGGGEDFTFNFFVGGVDQLGKFGRRWSWKTKKRFFLGGDEMNFGHFEGV